MSNDYTPTTAQVRDFWVSDGEAESAAEFDRWLAAHDAEVAAKAWDEGFIAGVNHDLGDWEVAPEPIVNPYRKGAAS